MLGSTVLLISCCDVYSLQHCGEHRSVRLGPSGESPPNAKGPPLRGYTPRNRQSVCEVQRRDTKMTPSGFYNNLFSQSSL